MFKNYLKIALRNISRHKGYSFINIFGLAVGITCALFILIYVRHEMSYDRFHRNANRVYQVLTHTNMKNNSISPTPLGPKLVEEFPEVSEAARYHWIWGGATLKYGDQSFTEDRLRFTEPSFFRLFDFPFIKGDPGRALVDTNSIVITRAIAQKYFGNGDPLGKVLILNREYPLTVTGVIENIPANSTLRFDMLVPIEFNIKNLVDFQSYTSWDNLAVYTFIKFQDQVSIDGFGQEIDTLFGHHTKKADYSFSVLPFTDRYFFFFANRTNTYAFMTIAVFILLIACFNFMNLSTARSARRAKEIGMRKNVGALRKQIIFQFLGESLLLSVIAGMFALILFDLLHPLFNTIIGKEIVISPLFVFLGVITVVLLTGIVAGCYPAFVLANLRLIHTLKGYSIPGFKSHGLRKATVVVQFILSIILITSMLFIHQQKKFMQNKEVGYQKECVINIPMSGGSSRYYQAYKNELLKNPGIVSITGSAVSLPFFDSRQGGIQWEGKDPSHNLSVDFNTVDYDFVETLQIDVLAGRTFSRAYPADVKSGLLVNEEMAKLMGPNPIIGARLDFPWLEGNVIGVIGNFHFRPMNKSIQPLVLMLNPEEADNLLIRIRPKNIASTLAFIEKTWKVVVSQDPLDYRFLEAEFDKSLFSLGKTGILLVAFSVLAIIISCLGLFGLSSYATEQRTKEIGIRKVFGVSVPAVVFLFSKEFIKSVLMANIIAWPAAYFLMNKWLQNFAYRVDLSVWTFLLSGLAVLVIALLTVSCQSIKAATANPVKSLRFE